MEKKSGFKECPRCGLRNKILAIECDFCGWKFSDVEDEWTDHLLELERIALQKPEKTAGKEESKIVEATLVRVKDLSRDEKEEPLVEYSLEAKTSEISETPSISGETPISRDFEESSAEDRSETLPSSAEAAQPSIVPVTEDEEVESPRLDRETTIIETEVKEIAETVVEEKGLSDRVAVEKISSKDVSAIKKFIVDRGEIRNEESAKAESFAKPMGHISLEIKATLLTAGFVIVGFSAYLTILLISSVFTVNWFLGWTVSIVGALMVVFGFTQIIGMKRVGEGASRCDSESSDMNGDNEELEVLICPVCHEVVSSDDQICPACGAIFKSSEQESVDVM
ncbi:MAG: hypothetical protein NO474_00980 [Methanomassiliicoccales archaeon]|nr:hypothetical protein [Methanomassiliicoccales archaeon]